MAKAFAWSYSKLKNFDSCPKRHYEIDIAKTYREDDSDQLVWGDKVHKAFAAALKSTTGVLPDEMKDYQSWIDRLRAGAGELMVEEKYALTKDFQPTEWFGPRVWMRGICDALRIDGPVALAVDWKTGKIKVDSTQLMLMAQCIFAHFPEVKVIKTKFVWLQEDCDTTETYYRSTIAEEWIPLLPRVEALENAAKTVDYPPKPGRLCAKWCPVTSCPYHGKRHG